MVPTRKFRKLMQIDAGLDPRQSFECTINHFFILINYYFTLCHPTNLNFVFILCVSYFCFPKIVSFLFQRWLWECPPATWSTAAANFPPQLEWPPRTATRQTREHLPVSYHSFAFCECFVTAIVLVDWGGTHSWVCPECGYGSRV